MIWLKKVIMSEWVYRVGRWFYAAVFLYAGLNKLLEPQSFAVVIEAFGLVPEVFILPIAVLIPVLEILAALGLIFDIRGSLTMAAVLLIAFLMIVGYGVWMGLDLDCGCFGPGDPEGEAYGSLRPSFYRNIFLILGTVFLYFRRYARFRVPAHAGDPFTMITKMTGGRMSNGCR